MTEVELYAAIGGSLGVWFDEVNSKNPNSNTFGNTCAARLSFTMNKAGFIIPETAGTWKGANNLNYFINAQYMYNYLVKTYNGSQLVSGNNVLNAIIAQTDGNSNGTINHVDIVYNGQPGNNNSLYWITTYFR